MYILTISYFPLPTCHLPLPTLLLPLPTCCYMLNMEGVHMDFDVSYFEEETRLGFTIPSFMKHAWAAQLNVLNRIDKICRDNSIPYYANS